MDLHPSSGWTPNDRSRENQKQTCTSVRGANGGVGKSLSYTSGLGFQGQSILSLVHHVITVVSKKPC